MDSLGRMFLLANLGTVSCLLFCDFLTENGWYSVDPANRICFKYNDKASTWWGAKRSCEQQGLFLARPDSESINTFLQVMRGGWKKPIFWIGGINDEDSGWKWTNGDDMDFTDFYPFLGTVNGIISFFKKSTYCALFGYQSVWEMKSCGELAPYLCQSEKGTDTAFVDLLAPFTGRNTTLTTVNLVPWLPRTRFTDTSTKYCQPVPRQEFFGTISPRTSSLVYFEERSSWWDANKACHEQNMSLVIVSDDNIDIELHRIRGALIIDIWIGAINKDNTGWKWGNGEDMVYTNFNSLRITWYQIFKQTLCGVHLKIGWGKEDCDKLYPFVCQFYTNSTSTPLKRAERYEQTTSTSSLKPKAISVEHHKRKMFKVKKMVGGRLNPKLIHGGQNRASAIDQLTCCRLSSTENGCELINFCKMSSSCMLYGNFDSAVSGGVTSERGCSIYVDVEKLD